MGLYNLEMLRKDPFVTGEYYHLYNRGIDKRIIFKSTSDYERFLMLLHTANTKDSFRLDVIFSRGSKKFNDILFLDVGAPLVSIGAWCLMPNHFHLIVRQEVDGGITKFMKKAGTGYAMYFNNKYKRQGALFGGPFKSRLVGVKDRYLKHLFGYIHLNPLELRFPNWEEFINKPRKDMTSFLNSYRYSSYQEYIGQKRVENTILSTKGFPNYFKNTKHFRDFIESYLSDREV